MNFIQFLLGAEKYYSERQDTQRRGQAYWNFFYDSFPTGNLRSSAMESEVDPFYDDGKIPAFLAWLSYKI